MIYFKDYLYSIITGTEMEKLVEVKEILFPLNPHTYYPHPCVQIDNLFLYSFYAAYESYLDNMRVSDNIKNR
jgi:hypothetical protein